MRGKTRKILGIESEEISRSIKKKFIKQETISGILCKHYEITQEDLSRDVNAGTMHEGSQFDKTWEAQGFRHYIQHYGADITMRIYREFRTLEVFAYSFSDCCSFLFINSTLLRICMLLRA